MFQKMLQGGNEGGNVRDVKWIIKDGELESGYSFRQMAGSASLITKRNGYYELVSHVYGSGAGIDIINSGYKYVFVDVLRQTANGNTCFFDPNGYNTGKQIILAPNSRYIIACDISNSNNIVPTILGWQDSYTVYLYNLWMEK